MHDLKALRENPAHYDASWALRGLSAQTPAILEIDSRLRTAMTKRMEAEAVRNSASKAIGAAKAQKNEAEAARLMAEVAEAKTVMEESSQIEAVAQAELDAIIQALPNLPDLSVPVGDDETGNVWSSIGAPRRNSHLFRKIMLRLAKPWAGWILKVRPGFLDRASLC